MVDPREVDDVGFLEFGEGGDVSAVGGRVYLPEVFLREAQVEENAQSLAEEVPSEQGRTRQLGDGDVIGELVSYEHLCLDAIVVEGVLETIGGDSRASRLLTGVDDEYSHGGFVK